MLRFVYTYQQWAVTQQLDPLAWMNHFKLLVSLVVQQAFGQLRDLGCKTSHLDLY